MIKKCNSIILLLGFAFFAHGQQDLNQFSNKIDSFLLDQNVPGSQILVVNSDSIIWSKYFGYADIKKNKKVTAQTRFRIASISKSLMAAAAMQLHEKGMWSIHDDLLKIIPNAQITNDYDEPVKLIHLLEHTSGLGDLSFSEFAGSCINCSCAEAYEKIARPNKLRWKPGEFMSYTNWGIVYMSEAISRQSKMSYEQYMKQYLFDPLGMNDCSFQLDSITSVNLSLGYKGNPEPKELPYKHLMDAPGSLNISALELSYFLRMLMNKGKHNNSNILSEASINLMETTQTTLAAQKGFPDMYGKGLFRNQYNGNVWNGHWGDFAGYHSSMYYNRDSDIGYIILINQDEANVYGIEKLIRNFFTTENEVLPKENAIIEPKFLGYYNLTTPRFKLAEFRDFLYPFIKVYKKDNEYLVEPVFGNPRQLYVMNNNLASYRTNSGYDKMYMFMENNNERYFKIDRTNYVQTNLVQAWSRIVVPIIAILTFLLGLIFIPISCFFKSSEHTSNIKTTALLSIISFMLMMFFLFFPVIQNQVIELLGRKSIWSQGAFAFSLLFVLFNVLMTFSIWKNWKKLRISNKFIYPFYNSVFWITIIYLSSFRMIGLQTWI